MTQSKRGSLLEASLNTASGFVVSLIVWRFLVAPMFGFSLDMETNVAVTSIFTVVSIARSYAWRRLFNRQTKVSNYG
jgi:hypothetical protein